MFERFTDQARRVVVLAQEEARRFDHDYIGTEHLLLGLLHESDGGLAAQALAEVGVSREVVREQVMSIIGSGERAPSGHIPFTPRAKKVLELSLREALQLGSEFIGTEHLLLGLIREGGGVAAQVLTRLGKSLDDVRQAVFTLYEQQPPDYGEREARAQGERIREREEPGSGPRFPLPAFLQGRGLGRGSGPQTAREYSAASFPRTPVRSTDPVVPRPEELEQLIAALARRERNNALLIGPSGVGKSALVRELAQALSKNQGPVALGRAEVLDLDFEALRLGAERILRRRAAPIVLVEDLDLLLRADDLSGGRLVTGLAGLAEAETPLVVTGTAEARERLEQAYPTLAARFEAVELPEADQALVAAVLGALRPSLQEFHRITIEDSALEAAVELATWARGGRVPPGGAVDVLDAAAARAAARKVAVLDGDRLHAAS